MRRNKRAASIALRQNDPGKSHRSARTGIYRERANVTEWPAGNQQNTADWTFACNAQLRQKIEAQSVQLGTGNKTDIRFAVSKRLRACGGKIETKIENASLRTMKKSPDQRPCIEVADGGNDQGSVYRTQCSRAVSALCNAMMDAGGALTPAAVSALLFSFK